MFKNAKIDKIIKGVIDNEQVRLEYNNSWDKSICAYYVKDGVHKNTGCLCKGITLDEILNRMPKGRFRMNRGICPQIVETKEYQLRYAKKTKLIKTHIYDKCKDEGDLKSYLKYISAKEIQKFDDGAYSKYVVDEAKKMYEKIKLDFKNQAQNKAYKGSDCLKTYITFGEGDYLYVRVLSKRTGNGGLFSVNESKCTWLFEISQLYKDIYTELLRMCLKDDIKLTEKLCVYLDQRIGIGKYELKRYRYDVVDKVIKGFMGQRMENPHIEVKAEIKY